MYIDTTIRITKKNLYKLNRASESLGIPRNKVIELLINAFMKKHSFKARMFKTVQYQEKAEKNAWSTIHVWFDLKQYENCQDIRKIYKISVSYMIGFAINSYLSILLNTGTPSADASSIDNYHFEMRDGGNYIFFEQDCGGIQGFFTFWGCPKQEYLEKYLL